MKNLIAVLAFALLIVLWPVTANASLISYDISFTVLAQNLSLPIYGDIPIEVHFVQDSEGDPFHQNINAFSSPYNLYPYTFFSVGLFNPRSGVFSLTVISPTDVHFFIGDPGGNVFIDFLYNTPLGPFPLTSPLPEPDSLVTFFQSEMSPPPSFPCNVPDSPPCPLGTSGAQTFARGEFNFSAVPESPAWLLSGFGLICIAVVFRKNQ